MSSGATEIAAVTSATRRAEWRRQLELIRGQARQRFAHGATALQIAGGLSQAFDELIGTLWDHALRACAPDDCQRLREGSAAIAIGGSGRGEMAPYSDVDLLFLYRPEIESRFSATVAGVVRDSWDAGLKLGHSVRTVRDAVAAARQDIHFATALTDARLVWGSPALLEELLRRYRRAVFRGRVSQFQAECVAAREQERHDAGGPVLQLEPDIKRSFGGLRDVHLIRWIACAHYGVADLDSLRLRGVLSVEDARRLSIAYEHLFGYRINLHFHAGKTCDVLTRDQQLRLATEKPWPVAPGQLPVERLMQEYFQHSLAVAEIADRFVARHQRTTWQRRWLNFLMTVRIDEAYRVGAGAIDIPRRYRKRICGSLAGALKLYLTAARYGVAPTDRLQQWIKDRVPLTADAISPEAARLFLQFLATPGKLGLLLRSQYQTGILEAVLPAFRHTRCLLQFNLYHSYTVDEHTLRTIEVVESFAGDRGLLGQAYREIRHKEILHLALLLHDAGKGFAEDHSEVGRRLAEEAAVRFHLSESQRALLVFLVHRHLLMAELAFRRDASDPHVLLNFSHEVGSPENLKLLFVLTAADISAVGPGVWTHWKAELLTSLYVRTMEWLSGQSQRLDQAARCNLIRREVAGCLASDPERETLLHRLEAFPAHYLLSVSPERIAGDLRIVQSQQPGKIHVEGRYEPDTGTVSYRVIAHEDAVTGCFHKLTGILTAQRMEILSAAICTSLDGAIIDNYQAVDHDHAGEVPEFRIADVREAIGRVLTGQTAVESLLQNRPKFGPKRFVGPLSNLPLRVVIDNDWSDRYTIIEVFAHDRSGLLYLIAKTMFELDLSVVRAQIATHFDQVVDVFYVTDRQGRKIAGEERFSQIRDRLTDEIRRFEQSSGPF